MNSADFISGIYAACEAINENQYPETYQLLQEIVAEDKFTNKYIISYLNEFMYADPTERIAPCIRDILFAAEEDGTISSHPELANDYGTLFYDGRIGKQDFNTAAEFYQQAFQGKVWVAGENLGYIWYYGRTGTVDYEKAYHYFNVCAAKGFPISMYKLGDMFRHGYYVAKNETTAFNAYLKAHKIATEQDMPDVLADTSFRLAICFEEGIGCEVDLANALIFYQTAEGLFYQKILNGNYFMKKSYQTCIDKQAELRKKLQQNLPDFNWTK